MLKLRLALLVVLALIVGCTRSPYPSKVTGTVTYQGKALKAGNITFHTENKGSYSSTLSLEGTYEMVDLPVGTVTVTVETDSANPDKKPPSYGGKADKMYEERMAVEKQKGMAMGGLTREEMQARFVKIPDKYASANTSGLTATLTSGRQVKNFELSD
jgi:hypothetical protein